MSGNVWVWCWNWWTSEYDENTEGGDNPTGASAGSNHVSRGGSWSDAASYASVSRRHDSNPASRNNTCGFRVVRASSK